MIQADGEFIPASSENRATFAFSKSAHAWHNRPMPSANGSSGLRAMTDKPPEREADPNGWNRFEKAVDAALHPPPKASQAPKPKPAPKR